MKIVKRQSFRLDLRRSVYLFIYLDILKIFEFPSGLTISLTISRIAWLDTIGDERKKDSMRKKREVS